MKKNILAVYALAVCFVTIVCAVIAAGIGAYDMVELAVPEFTLSSYQHDQHQSNDAFFQGDCEKKSAEGLTEEAKTAKRLSSYETAIKAERRDAIQSLIKVLIVLLIDLAVFFAHWKLMKRSSETSQTA